MAASKLVVFIATPLEAEHVASLRAIAPDRAEIVAEPDLWPKPRYVADHVGVRGFVHAPEQRRRWVAHLARADALWDFPPPAPDGGGGGLVLAPRARWVQTTSAGVGQKVRQLGLVDSDVIVTTARGVHAGPLAEFAFLALLAHVKRLDHLRAEQAAKRWERLCTGELEGRTLAIVGAGAVGARVAQVARAFGMRVVGVTRRASPAQAAERGLDAAYPPARLREALAQADAVVAIAPHTDETENMIDASAFAAMRDGVTFVNIGRGATIDEAAMIAALRSGKIGFAALDVFATEPLPADSALWSMPNVLVSPHSASTAFGENARIVAIFRHNLLCFLDGRVGEMRNVLDKRRLY
jgi:phosphoglycerate dehydrogenase-like enzyme